MVSAAIWKSKSTFPKTCEASCACPCAHVGVVRGMRERERERVACGVCWHMCVRAVRTNYPIANSVLLQSFQSLAQETNSDFKILVVLIFFVFLRVFYFLLVIVCGRVIQPPSFSEFHKLEKVSGRIQLLQGGSRSLLLLCI